MAFYFASVDVLGPPTALCFVVLQLLGAIKGLRLIHDSNSGYCLNHFVKQNMETGKTLWSWGGRGAETPEWNLGTLTDLETKN
jgi:hypothetical protein